MKTMEDKRAVVTGAGSGIGRAIAARFGSEGAEVFLFDRDKEAAETVAAEIRAKGGQATAVEVDVSQQASVQAAFDSLDRIDVLVNNAGVSSIGNVEATSPEELDRVYAINIKGVYFCLQAAVSRMTEQKSGVILNLASIASKLGIQDRFAYSMSKGAVLSMSLSVARDYVESGIRCNCICPARVRTPFVDAFLDKHYAENREEMFAKLSEFQPIGRMGEPEEIAALARFLCSDESSFITGSAYDIDGGVSLLR